MKDVIDSINTSDGLFHDGDQSTGALGTIVTATFQNDVQAGLQSAQAEIISVLKAANPGVIADPTKSDQLLAALKTQFLQTASHFAEIKAAGPLAVSASLANLGSGDGTLNGRLINWQDFSASGTYTPFPGTKFIIVEVTAGGGPGGSTPATGSTQVAAGAGGGAGGTAISKLLISAITSTVAITVGQGGVANTSTTGSSGGVSSFGSYLSASGGAFSANASAVTQGDNQLTYNGGGGDGTSGNMDNIRGGCGVAGFVLKYGYESGEGGRSYHCAGGPSIITLGSNTPGVAGRRGSGGSGAFAGNNASALLGGNGGNGFVRIWEYA